METGSGEIERQSDTMGLKDYYYALRLNDGRILRIAQEVDAVWVVFASGLPLCLGLILLISFVCVLASRILTRQLMKPIEDVAGKLNDDFVDSPYPELYPFISKIRKQHEEVLAAAKMRQDFSANVSHELKTPLTAISGYAQLLGSDDTPAEKRKHFADEIDKNANRLLALIEDIIKLSELDSDDNDEQFETVDLYELAAEELDSLSMAASQRNIDITLSGASTSVRCRPDLIRELIDNLVQNSIRYGNDGGHVTVSVLEEYGYKKLIVEDDGIGIPADDLDRVFERFYRVDKSRSKASGGTGLGLAIVKHIVEIHDAKIQIESELGVGTKVTVMM
ncbi:two-component system, OmpR family, phosphate regulon sensor histidine kinase PhoR [Pseudobutyrivibrio sp. JW11]|nr:two-component system, OmpR family, phosphate regulon sensor histidine kinase PhoR [Pseudobutyrivibrio sp. JW11]